MRHPLEHRAAGAGVGDDAEPDQSLAAREPLRQRAETERSRGRGAGQLAGGEHHRLAPAGAHQELAEPVPPHPREGAVGPRIVGAEEEDGHRLGLEPQDLLHPLRGDPAIVHQRSPVPCGNDIIPPSYLTAP